MTFSERMKGILDQGLAVSKELAIKAGEKAQDLGERGILMLEVKQLESQAQKLLARLGNEAYFAFTESDLSTIDREDAVFKTILEELSMIKDAIELKETELKDRK
jgi:hypothetical protein